MEKINQLKLWLTHFLKKKWAKYLLASLLLFVVLNLLFPPKVSPSYSTLVKAADGTLMHAFLSNDDKWRMFVELKEITPTLRKAIIFKEDKYFYYHFGFNPVAIVRAATRNIISNKRTSGASTITMQVVRLLYPAQRTYLNKIIELLRAVQLELFYSKEEILQLYLNLVPYGSNIEGIKSASYLYFQKSPDRLSLAEVTALSIIPNRPTSLLLGKRNPEIVKERNKWLNRFLKVDLFSKQTIEDALQEPLVVSRHEAPKLAPHLAIRLKKEQDVPIIQTFINRGIQAKTEQIVFHYVNRLKAMNIQNAAVMVINNQTMQVEAYIGSADFGNIFDGGQVDGVRAVRSPGSALKPLLYATAFDKGIITPSSIINDVPTNFNGFEPENFDQRFNGKVSASFALANSLNIPAVKILRDLGKNALIDQLKKVDFQTIKKQSKDLGLSLVLGGCGVTLEEMTQLYAGFANNGVWKKANYITPSSEEKPVQLISESANFLITEILSQIKRPDLPNNFDYTYHLPKIAWKTGTSFGKRDAWSIGYNKKYTVGVWVGNFTGEGVPELIGAEIATPLLFQIFNTIDYNSSSGAYQQPKAVALRQVCAESGDLPNDFCTNKIVDYYISGISHTRKCNHLKNVFVNLAETMSYCTQCLPADASIYKQKRYQNDAPELISFYESKKIYFDKIPIHNPACTRIFGVGNNAPQIIGFQEGSEYYIDAKDPQQLQLSCQAANDVNEVYWYINDKILKKTKASEAVFFNPSIGKIKISCVDDKGRSSHVYIQVKAS